MTATPLKQGRRPPISEADEIIGENLRRCRLLRGKGQDEIGTKLGVTHQSVQKYESAEVRISAVMLARAGQALNVPIDELYKGVPNLITRAMPNCLSKMDKDSLILWHAYQAIACPQQRAALLNLARTMAQAED